MEIIRLPEYDEVYKDVEELRKEIPRLIGERDELIFVICKNIETAYMLAVGSLEYKVYEAECIYRRLKRKLQLIRAKKNRQEKINLSEIESLLDEEMEEYKNMLLAKMQAMNEALARNEGKALSEKETKELKELYRKIVKELHPDLNPDITEEQTELFLRAVMAYKNGDIDTLRLISEMVGEPISNYREDSFSELVKTREKLFASLQRVKNEIELIKGRFPYNKKDFIDDKEAIEQRKLELEGAIFDYKQMIIDLEEKIKELTKNEQ